VASILRLRQSFSAGRAPIASSSRGAPCVMRLPFWTGSTSGVEAHRAPGRLSIVWRAPTTASTRSARRMTASTACSSTSGPASAAARASAKPAVRSTGRRSTRTATITFSALPRDEADLRAVRGVEDGHAVPLELSQATRRSPGRRPGRAPPPASGTPASPMTPRGKSMSSQCSASRSPHLRGFPCAQGDSNSHDP
jgi:hypothetical protein